MAGAIPVPAHPRRVATTAAGASRAPLGAGIGLRHQHLAEVAAKAPAVDWLEIHAENYLSAGGPHIQALERIRRDAPISCHCVGMSLGSARAPGAVGHLRRLRALFEWCEPVLVSDHLSWSVAGSSYLNDLLPLPYTVEALNVVCDNVDRAQEVLGRRLLIENPSTYLSFANSTIPEPAFLAEAARRTGCGILLDLNNVFVSCNNLGGDPVAYLNSVPKHLVHEIHVAGHASASIDGNSILIDDHGSPVSAEVWALLRAAIERLGPVPVLVEWDTQVPDLSVLVAEAQRAQDILATHRPSLRIRQHA